MCIVFRLELDNKIYFPGSIGVKSCEIMKLQQFPRFNFFKKFSQHRLSSNSDSVDFFHSLKIKLCEMVIIRFLFIR